ncbi:MAG: hypothetical protein QXZ28_01935 [Candidatus Methanomethylicaceae archaeon]
MNINKFSFNLWETETSTIPTSTYPTNSHDLKNQIICSSGKDEYKQYSLEISAETTSNAKILLRKVKDFVVGHKFTAKINVKNIGCDFPGGTITFRIIWPNGQIVVETRKIEKTLGSNESYNNIEFTTDSLCQGFALFTVEGNANDGKAISFFTKDKRQIKPFESFHSIQAKEPSEFYTRYALYISVYSFLSLLIEKIFWWIFRP